MILNHLKSSKLILNHKITDFCFPLVEVQWKYREVQGVIGKYREA
jgi:hypothetical protein